MWFPWLQGNSADYEKAVKAARDAWQVWADVSKSINNIKAVERCKN